MDLIRTNLSQNHDIKGFETPGFEAQRREARRGAATSKAWNRAEEEATKEPTGG
jgi:hypothetical protein